jgi:hypothetical protein
MKKLLICLSLISTLALSSCADRTRVQCQRTKNNALSSGVTIPIREGGGRCG